MRFSIVATLSLASAALAQNCGPQYRNQVCDAGKCCSQYGWCDTTPDHCNPENCLKSFSGPGSSCSTPVKTFTTKITQPTSSQSTSTPSQSVFPSAVPEIDVCGAAEGGVTCPGAGANGYFYRCCSSAGHCGPKNDLQDQNLYCGDGCQAGFGKCDSQPKPPQPTEGAGVSGEGGECGPIVNKKCADGLCCSGSNFCGTSEDFCGAENWCQPNWGECDED